MISPTVLFYVQKSVENRLHIKSLVPLMNPVVSKINNKDVCLVSYAAYMENRNMGRYIDSFETVIRINNGLARLHHKDLGEKIDILSLFCAPCKLGYVLKSYNEINHSKYTTVKQILIDQKLSILFQAANYKNLGITGLNSVYNDFAKYGLTSGTRTFLHLIAMRPKKIFMTGFDFSNRLCSKYAQLYKKYRPDFARKRLNKEFSDWTKKHDKQFEIYIINTVVTDFTDIIFEFDPILKGILDSSTVDKPHSQYVEQYKLIKNDIKKYRRNNGVL